MKPEQAKMLREPFPPEQVGKLPGSANRPALDYVGHAAVTDRLLKADPDWTWEPAGLGTDGRPILERDEQGHPVGMWIRLTVAGVTRPGYGSVQAGAQEAVKQLISDALRNAAMRFGVALDLWAKEDLTSSGETPAGSPSGRVSPDKRPQKDSRVLDGNATAGAQSAPKYGWRSGTEVARGGGGAKATGEAGAATGKGSNGRAEADSDSPSPAALATKEQLRAIEHSRRDTPLSEALSLVDVDDVASLTFDKAALLISRLNDVRKTRA